MPAAWLVEQAGFRKGYRRDGVGISSRHALALVNYGGTTGQLLDLAWDIEHAVFERFGIWLEREAVVIPGGGGEPHPRRADESAGQTPTFVSPGAVQHPGRLSRRITR